MTVTTVKIPSIRFVSGNDLIRIDPSVAGGQYGLGANTFGKQWRYPHRFRRDSCVLKSSALRQKLQWLIL